MSAEIPTGYRLPLVEEGTWLLPDPTMEAIKGDVASDMTDESTPVGASTANVSREIVQSDAPDVIAYGIRNPESELYDAVLDITGGVVPIGVPSYFRIESLSAPRPSVPAGTTVVWLYETSDPDVRPVNMADGDIYQRITPEPIPFNPLNIPGIAVWLDAATLGLSGGAAVTSWTNRVTGSPAFTVMSGTPPVYETASVNGHPAVKFDGVAGVLKADGFASYAGPSTVYLVARSTPATTTGTDFFYDSGNPVTGTLQLGLGRNAAGAWVVYRATNFTVAGSDNSAHLFRAVYNGASSSLKVGSAGTPTTGSTSVTPASTFYTVGGRGDGANGLDGVVCALVIIRGTVSAQDDADLTQLLMDTYGVA